MDWESIGAEPKSVTNKENQLGVPSRFHIVLGVESSAAASDSEQWHPAAGRGRELTKPIINAHRQRWMDRPHCVCVCVCVFKKGRLRQ